jgi:hypothetical protein
MSWLFDSTDTKDHAEAAAICATCPMLTACRKLLDATAQEYGYDYSFGPRGTWAGKYLAPPKPRRVGPTPPPRTRPECGTEAGYQQHRAHKQKACDACRIAHEGVAA